MRQGPEAEGGVAIAVTASKGLSHLAVEPSGSNHTVPEASVLTLALRYCPRPKAMWMAVRSAQQVAAGIDGAQSKQLPAGSGRKRASKGGSPTAALDGDLPAQPRTGLVDTFQPGLRSWTGLQDLVVTLPGERAATGRVDAFPQVFDASTVAQIDCG